jgi:hypothetical protein
LTRSGCPTWLHTNRGLSDGAFRPVRVGRDARWRGRREEEDESVLRAVRGRSTRGSKQRGGEDVILLCATRRAQDGIESGARNGGHGPAKWELFFRRAEAGKGFEGMVFFFFRGPSPMREGIRRRPLDCGRSCAWRSVRLMAGKRERGCGSTEQAGRGSRSNLKRQGGVAQVGVSDRCE